MKKYQIVDAFGNYMHAGSKATNDCMEILSNIGFEKYVLNRVVEKQSILSKIKRQISYLLNWRRIYKDIEPNSIVVTQNPFRTYQMSRTYTLKKLKKNKNVKFISIIHDVELIRGDYYTNFKTEKEFKDMLEIADKLIVHNKKMKQWFLDYGISSDRLVSLEIFDYLNEDLLDKEIVFSNKVKIAGNLTKDKGPYIYKLHELNVDFDLYGINYIDEGKHLNINYHGAFPAEELPQQFADGFGLVWDGTSLETCDGETGHYLKYNNPHKLSLYLSSGIPVIIWDQAAEAEFVSKHKIGITVSSLHDLDSILNNITKDEYRQMIDNVKIIKKQLKEGYYLTNAIESIRF